MFLSIHAVSLIKFISPQLKHHFLTQRATAKHSIHSNNQSPLMELNNYCKLFNPNSACIFNIQIFLYVKLTIRLFSPQLKHHFLTQRATVNHSIHSSNQSPLMELNNYCKLFSFEFSLYLFLIS